MRRQLFSLFAGFVLAGTAATSQAAVVSLVDGGETSVVFGNGALASIGLQIAGIGGDTMAPGGLGPNSVAFPISSRADGTTFSYDPLDFLGTFSGAIEHAGTVTLASAALPCCLDVTVGDFTIGFDATRIGGDASGFFVRDTVGTNEILFDVGSPLVESFGNSLVVVGNLLISSEFSNILNTLALVGSDVTGVDAGLALVVAEASPVPLPAAVWLLGSALLGVVAVRRRTA